MKNYLKVIIVLTLIIGCSKGKKQNFLLEGIWQGRLTVMDNQTLPFNFKLYKSTGNKLQMDIYNADEVITVDEIVLVGDSINIKIPVFEGYIAGKATDSSISGAFTIASLDRVVPFEASYGLSSRFSKKRQSKVDVTGIWETEFSPMTEDRYMGKGIFKLIDGEVTGTFRTTTGDYRFLQGIVDGDSLKISAFDGAHAFLFTAKVTDSTMNGIFYSGNHFKEPFIAKRNELFDLESPDSLTFLKKGYDKLAFSFPDVNGNMVSLGDTGFNNKVVLVQIMGTWCPNCLDETKFLVDYLDKNPNEDLKVIGLAFEYAKTEALAQKSIQRLVDRVKVNYPVLLAQFGSSDKVKAQEKLPMLNHVLSYPTTIFIDKKGKVRKIHTGFNGPATGEKFVEFKKEFNSFLNQLLEE
ncbi:peroxiredoxin family protein [Maribacter sp. CXY002]|uniref:peroxiredoxin family protein n=1 Tax=Maribacter luteocoastalis TaxID=3407671 RepID=UPI003B6746AD